jgi:predicted amidohydrolase YtcJ
MAGAIRLWNTNPMKAIYATVTRNSDAGKFEPEQALTVTESLKMWTIWAAKALGEENLKQGLHLIKELLELKASSF